MTDRYTSLKKDDSTAPCRCDNSALIRVASFRWVGARSAGRFVTRSKRTTIPTSPTVLAAQRGFIQWPSAIVKKRRRSMLNAIFDWIARRLTRASNAIWARRWAHRGRFGE